MHQPPRARFLDRATPPHIATLILLTGFSTLSLNLFLPSLPRMTEHFQTDYAIMQLSVSGFLAANAIFQLVVGPISDRYGRRPVLLTCLALFLVATLGTLTATTIELFLLARICQAVVVAAMVVPRAILRDLYDTGRAASMLGYVTMGMAIMPMLGPAIGGFLDEAFGWQANFWLLFAIGAITLTVTWFDLKETNTTRSSSFAAQIRDYPELFRSRRFWGYALSAGFASGAFFAFLGGAPFVGVQVFGLTPSQLGLYFMPTAFGYIIGNFLSGRFSQRVGITRLIMLGACSLIFAMLGSWALFAAGATAPAAFFGMTVFIGVGNGLVLPNATAGMLSVRPRLAGTASGLGGALMIGFGAALSVVVGIWLTRSPGPYPLIWMMLMCGVAALLMSLYVRHIDRIAGPPGRE